MTNEEISFFDRLSETWDDDEILSTPDRIKKFLSYFDIEEGMRILDLGTGTGVLLPYLAEKVGCTGKVTGVDVSTGMLNKAKEKFGHLRQIEFLLEDFENRKIEGRYDFIFLYSVYPHLTQPEKTIKALCENNLREGGAVVIAFPADEEFVNRIHRERKADSHILPSACELSEALVLHGIRARVVNPAFPYIVEILEGSAQ